MYRCQDMLQNNPMRQKRRYTENCWTCVINTWGLIILFYLPLCILKILHNKVKKTLILKYKELKAEWFSRFFFFSLKTQNHSDLILLFSLLTASLRYNLHPYNSPTVSVQFIEFQLVKQLYNHYNSDLILNQENFFFGWELFYFFNFLLLWK